MILRNIKNKLQIPLFLTSVLMLSLGTLVSQCIGFLVLPIISRFYAPSEFGLFYTFLGFSQTLGLFSSLKYEKSIILPNEDKEANVLFLLTLTIIGTYCVLLLIALSIISFLQLNLGLAFNFLMFVPLSISVYAINSTVTIFFQRQERFKVISMMVISQSFLVAMLSIVFSFANLGVLGLILSYILGSFIVTLVVIVKNYQLFFKTFSSLNKTTLIDAFKKYKNFPKYFLLFDIMSSGTVFLIPILLTFYFTSTVSGFYSMAQKVILTPVVLIGHSVASVFLVEVQKLHNSNDTFYEVYISTLKKMFWLALLIYLPTFFFGEWFLVKLLGEKWEGIGIYVKYLTLLSFFDFTYFSFKANIFIITNNQKLALFLQTFKTIFCLVPFLFFHDYGFEFVISCYITSSILFTLIGLIVTFRLSKNDKAVRI